MHHPAFAGQVALAIEHLQDQVAGLGIDLACQNGQFSGRFERGFFALDDLAFQNNLREAVTGQQVFFEVLRVTRPDIQFATEALEPGNGHFAFDRQDVEVPERIRLADVIRVDLAGFLAREVMQCRVQQGNGSGHHAVDVAGIPGKLFG